MSTDTDDDARFDRIDWEAVSAESGASVSSNTLGMAVATAVLVALLVYDAVALGQYTATFAFVGWGYDVTGLDWLFAFTLLLFGFYGVLPLYQRPRMTRYYWREFRRNRPAVVSLVYLLAIFLLGVLGPLVIDRPEVALFQKYQPPVGFGVDTNYVIQCTGSTVDGVCRGTLAHPLGTTQQGEDVFRLVVYGMQISMKIAFIATFITVAIGAAVGTLSAYFGGLVDEALMRYVDVQQSFPTFIAYLLILYVFGGSLILFILLFGLFSWEGTARYVRSNALATTEEEYIKAAKLTGAGPLRIVRRHLLPNTASSIVTDVTLLAPAFILAEAQLAFLGLGDSEIPSWGQVIAAGRSDLAFAPWITLMPGLFLFFTILAFNFLGDALLDALNPKAAAEAERDT